MGAGYQVHSTLFVAAESRKVLGLGDQEAWIRETKEKRPGKATRQQRPYQEKESYKWSAAFQRMKYRMGDISKVITVCDREADIFEFLHELADQNARFVIRVSRDRALSDEEKTLFDEIKALPEKGKTSVPIEQRGAQRTLHGKQSARATRRGRTGQLIVQAGKMNLTALSKKKQSASSTLPVNVVHVHEAAIDSEKEGISWMLFTTEPIDELEHCLKVIGHDSARWLIEEFHKAWKIGCKIEERNLQTFENIERMMAMTAPIAVRILQLRSTFQEAPDAPCDVFFSEAEWMCLWLATEKKKPPQQIPTMKWAYDALAKRVGWIDSQKTGRGWIEHAVGGLGEIERTGHWISDCI